MTPLAPSPFDATHADRDDPWGVTTRWYEIRKRALCLAVLPDERYGRALEIGCSIGVLTSDLAARCDSVLGVDVSSEAVARAERRLAAVPGASARRLDVTDGLPEGPFDLVVLSEVGYYLDTAALRHLLVDIERVLSPGGVVLACHWRHPEGDFLQSGDSVHEAVRASQFLTSIAQHLEADFVLDVLSTDPRSVAARTGLR